MILNKQQAEPILTNVASSGEFRIRNSAKAFSILSSGLYANKIRAVIRELSCNAVDSHIAAGKADVPFVVHLPTSLEPYFSVTDVGLGLSHDQVTNIYTTYFESTKTGSNDFIGALGLGSKSPFSYTDNFSIVAAKDGIQNIYSAFINETGVPSVALMSTQAGDFPNGVEVKFSVINSRDYSNFAQEAKEVFKFFKLNPTITGNTDFEFAVVKYRKRDIMPGVHQRVSQYRDSSWAVMGNICYPIDVPNADSSLGPEMAAMLQNNLELHFDIGELDFQASREGLSYIPETIAAIKAKLEKLNTVLAKYIARHAKKLTNVWEQNAYLSKEYDNSLFTAAVKEYCTKANVPTFNSQIIGNRYYVNSQSISNRYYGLFLPVKTPISEIINKYNLTVSRFEVNSGRGNAATSKLRNEREYVPNTGTYIEELHLMLSQKVVFVVGDTNISPFNRARKHFSKRRDEFTYTNVVVLFPADKTKPADYAGFLKAVYDPKDVINASTLDKPAKVASKNGPAGTLVAVPAKDHRGRSVHGEYRWDKIAPDKLVATGTKYYIPLNNRTPEMTAKVSFGNLMQNLRDVGLKGICTTVYGVRKSEIAKIKGNKDWVNIETHVQSVLNTLTDADLNNLAVVLLDSELKMRYSSDVAKELPATSPFAQYIKDYKPGVKIIENYRAFNELAAVYRPGFTIRSKADAFRVEYTKILKQYPLLHQVLDTSVDKKHVAQYISLIDNLGETK